MDLNNIILKTDSYKLSHYVQYPKGTEYVYSYFESRTGATFSKTVFFGLQIFLKRYLEGVVVTKEKLEQAKKIADAHVGEGIFNYEGWKHILENHGGKLPVRIKAVPEGLAIPTGNVLMTVENTDPKCYWLTNYLETLLVQVWYPSTVATLSRDNKETILRYLKDTGDVSGIGFKCHDFGYRGVSSDESAGLGGAAHLVNFLGTDTLNGILYAMEYYGAEMPGFSIPASEHSTITSWEKEVDAFDNMLEQYKNSPLVACVSDSWDIEKACKSLWGTELKDKILNMNGTLVVRPDSGEPTEIVPKVIKWLAEQFGTYKNDKGYLVLNDSVRVIQGDGVTNESIGKIYQAVKDAGFSADNLAVGSGGGLLQMVNRDTQRFAFKCSSITVNGKERDVYKTPATDPTKNSKRGRLSLVYFEDEDAFMTVKDDSEEEVGKDILETVFENGKIIKEYTFDEVKKRAEIN